MRVTSEPGIGGRLKAVPEDFVVEELPAYTPGGAGDHVYAWIEKRDLTTFEAVNRIAHALRVEPRDVGTAGLKDRWAVTRQWISLPPPTKPEAVSALALEGLRILEVARHGNKLRTGHLRGNRFRIVVREPAVPVAEATLRARAVLARLARPPGLPNWFGEQRFGAHGDNAARGRAILAGGRGPRDQRQRRLLVSAYQSELFNRLLGARVTAGELGRVLDGDIMKKLDTGGLYDAEDVPREQERLDRGEVVPTGPMFGPDMRAPREGSAAAAFEAAILAAEGLDPATWRGLGKIAEGTRRAIAVPLGDPDAQMEGDSVVVSFTLPKGAYATIVLDEVMKPETG